MRHAGNTFRIWSGACSSDEQPCSMAMVLADAMPGGNREVFASDIWQTVLARAQAGLYPLERTNGIPKEFLRKYCLKGVRSQDGKLLVAPELRKRVRFEQANPTMPIEGSGDFDVIFLRNVMIYSDTQTKRKVVNNMIPDLKNGGFFVVSHSESREQLKRVRPTVCQKPT